MSTGEDRHLSAPLAASCVSQVLSSCPPMVQSVLLRDLTEACRRSPELTPRCLAPALDCVLLSVLRHSNFEDSTCIRGHRPVFPSTSSGSFF